MKLAFVEMAGFRGFREKVRLDFPEGFCVLTGRNGVGKSTAFDALEFALTGTIGKFVVKEAKGGGLEHHTWWVGDGVAEEQYVKICFRDGNEEHIVLRSRERGLETSLSVLASKLCLGGLSKQNWSEILMQTSLIRDETIAALSLDLPEQARFAAVRTAIGNLTGRDHSSRTKNVLNAALGMKEERERALAAAQADLGRALTGLTEANSIAERQGDLSKAEALLAGLLPPTSSPSARIDLLRKEIVSRKSAHSEMTGALSRTAQLNERLASLRPKSFPDILRESQASLAESRRILSEASHAMKAEPRNNELDSAFTFHLAALLEHGEALGLQSGHCPLCDASRSEADFASAILKLKETLSRQGSTQLSIPTGKARVQSELNKLSSVVREKENEVGSLERLEQESQALETIWKTNGVNVPIEDVPGLRQYVLEYQERTAQLEQALFILESSGAHDRIIALTSKVEALRQAVEEAHELLVVANRTVDTAHQIHNANASVANEILTEQFDTVLPLLKELYLRLRPHTDWREIETDFGGQVRASLNFTVGGKNPQFLFSSGQRRAAGISFLLAIHLSRPWCAFDSLLLDDPVQHIDDYRALNLVEVLAAIRRSGRQVIVAVEDAALADVLCRRLRSTTDQPGVRFELSTKPNGAATISAREDIRPLPKNTMALADAS
jgi:chromosome segregation protein